MKDYTVNDNNLSFAVNEIGTTVIYESINGYTLKYSPQFAGHCLAVTESVDITSAYL